MERMLVTEGLNELKLLDSRIRKETKELEIAAIAKKSNSNIYPNLSKEEFIRTEKAKFQSVQDLIDRRGKIKSAIVLSNALTKLSIAGKEYTVAEAIEFKNSIGYKESLMVTLSNRLKSAQLEAERKNAQMELSLDDLVQQHFGSDSKTKISGDDYDSIAIPYRKANETEVIDPLKAGEMAVKINNEIQEFLSSVDSALQICNCATYIEIE